VKLLNFLSAYFKDLIPQSVRCLPEMGKTFLSDLFAGMSVGIIAIPLALAFAIASGVPPEKGLYTVVVGGFLISFLGGSRFQIGGPTGAYVVLIYSIFNARGFEGLQIATLISGCLLILMALFKFGRLMKYVPQPVIVGFTAGIAVVILSSQLRDFFGLQVDALPPQFLDKCTLFCQEAYRINPWATLFAAFTTGSLFWMKRFLPKVPGAIVVLFVATAAAYLFALPIETIEGKFGVIPNPLPPYSLPDITWERLRELFPDGLALALLGAIEALLSAAVADRMTGTRHISNAELLGQGAANIGTAMFGGIPATAAIARTSANIRMGAKTPLAGMFHAITLFLVVYFLAPFAGKIPLAALAGILVFVAWNMGEFSHLVQIAKAHRTDGMVLFLTLILTVLVDITLAVQVGIVLSALLIVRRMGKAAQLKFVSTQEPDKHALSVSGPLFFSVSEDLKRLDLPPSCQELMIDLEGITLLDTSGVLAIKECIERWTKQGVKVSIHKIKEEWVPLFRRLGVIQT
jgi:SulP family sulfate permease